MNSPWVETGVGLLVGLTAVLTLFVVLLVWRDGYLRGWLAARISPATCMKCGYNLSGLSHCRCRECGVEIRLDPLWQAHLRLRRCPKWGIAVGG